ncbi:hypothetical protein [Amycolatopsis tolypomycina]|uniref:hypothetical protein n=1 Tax=Amycolatopsis tolypomycina TaxID=208445 RepID=UPI0033BF7298
MARPDFRITCCLCGKPIPRASDVYALDEEWQRRYPTMVGTLACKKCALSPQHFWKCQVALDEYVPGHHPAADPKECYDSWDHIVGFGTHAAMVMVHPYSGVLQGAEEYLRWQLGRPGPDNDLTKGIREALSLRDESAVSSQPR